MTFDFSKHKDELLFVPLGGSNEIGMNLNLYTIGGKWLMVDCGIMFGDDTTPGIEIITPDVTFITERREDLLGIVITLAAAFVIGPCAVENAPCAETTAPVVMIWGAVIAFLSAADALRLSKRRSE